MTEQSLPSLPDRLRRIEVLLAEPLDFHATAPHTTERKVRLLSAVALYLNTVVLTDFGGRLGPERQEGLVEQIVGAAFQTFEDVDPHPKPFDKAAMLLRGITQGHPFTDGNKRTGILLTGYYLERMGYPLPDPFPDEAIEKLTIRISAGQIRDIGEITNQLQRLWGTAERDEEELPPHE